MTILFLGYTDSPLIDFLKRDGNKVLVTDEKTTADFINENRVDYLISYGYRHILKKDILGLVPAINLHISFLPFNRGADPNFWSFIEGTPKGITIHQIDEGVDTGDILVQSRFEFSDTETLRSTYKKLQDAIQALFQTHWPDIKAGNLIPFKQEGTGTTHKAKDKRKYPLNNGLDMPISQLMDYISDIEVSAHFVNQIMDEIQSK